MPSAPDIAKALPEGAAWALVHAANGSDVSRVLPADLRSGEAWGVVLVERRRVRLTELGKEVARFVSMPLRPHPAGQPRPVADLLAGRGELFRAH